MAKSKFTWLFLVAAMSFSAFAQSDNLPITKANAGNLLKGRQVKFIENAGQLRDFSNKPIPSVLFKASLPGLDLYITQKGLTYVSYMIQNKTSADKNPDLQIKMPEASLNWERLDMQLSGARIRKENIIKEDAAEAHYNYYYAHCPDGLKNIKQYGRVTIKNIYPGIDWMLYNTEDTGFEYDFVVHPGADPRQIKMLYVSGQPLALNPSGNLLLLNHPESGSLTENAPNSYIKESREKINSSFKIVASAKKRDHFECLVGVDVENVRINNLQTLVIDPQLTWCTTVGGNSADCIASIDTDLNNNVFVTGHTQSPDFPVQNSGTFFQGTSGISFATAVTVFISKFSSIGALLWSTYYGGTGSDRACSVAVDSLQNIFVTGISQSTDFPVQNAGTFFQGTYGGMADLFILKFDNNGNRLWATYYGGSDVDVGLSVCSDKHGNIFLAGVNYSNNFPLQNAGTFFQGNPVGDNQGYILKFNNAGTRLWATYFACARLNAIASDQNDNIYVTGFTNNTTPTLNPGGGAYSQSPGGGGVDAVCAKFDNAGNLLWGSYYGGTNQDYGYSLVTDKNGNVFMSGLTRSNNLPVVGEGNAVMDSINSNPLAATDDAFIVKFGPASNLLWATYCGGPEHETMGSFDNLAVDGCNRVYMSFESSGIGAITYSACEGGFLDNSSASTDQFIIRFSNTGVRQWASYFGGIGPDKFSPLAVDNNGVLYMGGQWDRGSTASSSTYTFVNPGNGAFFSNYINGTVDAFISRFEGSSVVQPGGFSFPVTCAGSTLAVLPIFANTFTASGSFSGPSALNINSQTGQVSMSNAAAGTYTVNYFREACQCYASSAVFSIVNCTGIKEHPQNDNLFIYSNPNNGVFTVKGNSAMQLSLCNELGQELKNVSLSSVNDYQASFSELLPGIYFLKARQSGSTHKIIVIK